MTVQAPERGVFEANCYGGNWDVRPDDPAAVAEDPLFVKAGGAALDVRNAKGYALRRGSPCLGAGMRMDENGGRDILGSSVPQGKAPDQGAVQSR